MSLKLNHKGKVRLARKLKDKWERKRPHGQYHTPLFGSAGWSRRARAIELSAKRKIELRKKRERSKKSKFLGIFAANV